MRVEEAGRQRRAFRSGLTRLASAIVCTVLLAVPAAAGDDDFFTHLHTEKAMANVTVSPGRAGPVAITVELETMEEKPLTARAVAVTLSDPQTRRQLPPVSATRSGEAGWQVRIPMLTAGNWMLGLDISISDTDKFRIEAPISIR